MTTAETMFAQPGDGIMDRKQEARKVLWAFLAALFVHLVVAYSLATWGGIFSPALPVSEKPAELTIVDLSTPPPIVAAQGSAPPAEAPQPTRIAEAEEFAMLRSTPTPAVRPAAVPTPEQPRSSYRAQKQRTRLAGSITNRGASSVNALGTPLG